MPDENDKKIEDEINGGIKTHILLINEVIEKHPEDTALIEKLNKHLEVLSNKDVPFVQKRGTLAIVENMRLDFYLSEKGKGSK